MIHYVNGNLLNSNCSYICHQVNCQGKMGSGIAKAIRDKWPVVYERYKNWYEWCTDVACDEFGIYENGPDGSELMIGHAQIVNINDNQAVINMAAQQYYGYDGKRYTSYDAFWQCLEEIRDKVPEGKTIGFPANIGCCRGGANWNVIKAMIEEVLGLRYEVYIYNLGE